MNSEVRIQEPEVARRAPARNFQQLIVWQKAHGFVLEVYRYTEGFPRSETYGLTAQFRRAAISIAANIAQGSVEACRYFLILAKDLKYGDNVQAMSQLEETSKLLEGYAAKILTSDS